MRALMRMFFVTASIVLIVSIATPALAESASFTIESCVAQPNTIEIPQEAVIFVTIGGDQAMESVICSVNCRGVVEIASSPMAFDPGDGTWTARLSLPDNLYEGYYSVSVIAYDSVGDFIFENYEDILYVGNDHADASAPELVSAKLGTTRTQVPADVFLSAEARDENGVVYFYSDAFIIPGEEYGSVELEFNIDTQKWGGYLSLPADMPPGDYTVVYFIYDGACNFTEGELSQELHITGVAETNP